MANRKQQQYEWLIHLGMVIGLLIFYRGSYQLPMSALGLAIFTPLALLRPDLALAYVPLTVPLFFMPKGIWDERFGIRAEGVRFPLHEIVLLITAGASGLRWLLVTFGQSLAQRRKERKGSGSRLIGATESRQSLGTKASRLPQAGVWHRQTPTLSPEPHRPTKSWLMRLLPYLLFLLAGSIGVLIAPSEGRGAALREWRWLIVEPLIFYVLLKTLLAKSEQSLTQRRKDAKGRAEDDRNTIKGAGNEERVTQRRRGAETQRVGNDGEVSASPHLPASRGPYPLLPIIHAFLIGGALVGLVGILQYWGINLAPLIGDEVGFSEDVLFVEGVLRVNSVYGHANNLALYMGRIWPVACILALAAYDHRRVWHTLFYALCTALSIGGMYVAFSKGAQIGALGALGVLLLLQLLRELRRLAPGKKPSVRRLAPLLVLLVLFIVMLASGLHVERLNWLGASSGVRVKTWLATLEIIQAHPLLGIGLDQFNPAYQQVMHPSLRGTTEQYISHPHNLLLDIWLRMGMLGLIAFGWLIIRFYRAVWRRSVDTIGFNAEAQRSKEAESGAKQRAYTQELSVSAIIGFASAMTAALLHGLVDNFYFVPDLAFAFWLGLAVVTIAVTADFPME